MISLPWTVIAVQKLSQLEISDSMNVGQTISFSKKCLSYFIVSGIDVIALYKSARLEGNISLNEFQLIICSTELLSNLSS